MITAWSLLQVSFAFAIAGWSTGAASTPAPSRVALDDVFATMRSMTDASLVADIHTANSHGRCPLRRLRPPRWWALARLTPAAPAPLRPGPRFSPRPTLPP